MAVPKRRHSSTRGKKRRTALEAEAPHAAGLQPLQQPQAAASRVRELRLLRRRRDRSAARKLGRPKRSAWPDIPRIGIDAMGGDLGPSAVAEGTVLACREMPGQFRVTLVGR